MRKRVWWRLAGLFILLAAAADAPAQGVPDSGLPQPVCGTVSIARMPWPSAALLAEIHAQILGKAFGCTVEIVAGDPAATVSAMTANGEPAIAPELWIARIADLWNGAVEAQKVRQAGPSFAGGPMEGWFIPDFVAAGNPKLKSAAQLKDYAQIFSEGRGKKPRFISCPPDWGCAIVNRNLLRALKIDEVFEIVEPANRFDLDGLIGNAMSRKEPVLFYYWQPNPVLAQFSFTALELGAYNPAAFACLGGRGCAAPELSAFVPEPVIAALAERVFTDLPQVAGYFQLAHFPLEEMNLLLAWQAEQEADAAATAAHFVETREEVWRPWVAAF